MNPTSSEVKKTANEFVSFLNASPTPYHLVKNAKASLETAGFKEIRERDDWNKTCKQGGKYYLSRNGSTLLAFTYGQKWQPGSPVAIIGAHTDSPVLRVKPISSRETVGYLQVGVETYGGGIWTSWLDRDLSLAGRVMVKAPDGSVVQKLVKVEKPILRIPTMAVHFRKNPPDKMEISTETQLLPILGLASSILNGENAKKEEPSETEKKDESFNPLKPMFVRHHSSVIDLIASEASVPPSDVIDFELVLYDTQKSCIGGINDEFIFSPRLDNQGMSFCALTALIRASKTAIEDSNTINLISLFDHEEVGSLSQQGADGNLLPSVLKRLCDLGKPSASALEQTSAKSFIISADMAHAVHPNYVGAYESKHHPMLNGGTVLKINANQRYTTNSPGIVLLQEIARKKEVPLQLFVVDNTSPCGGTIGPMSAAKTGIRTLDLGNPQLSMHSIRETGGVVDVEYGVRLFEGFFEGYGALEEQIIVD